MIRRWFLDHPRSLGETYLAHQRAAWSIGVPMVAGGLACLVHGAVPALFVTTGSRTIARLQARITQRRGGAASNSDG